MEPLPTNNITTIYQGPYSEVVQHREVNFKDTAATDVIVIGPQFDVTSYSADLRDAQGVLTDGTAVVLELPETPVLAALDPIYTKVYVRKGVLAFPVVTGGAHKLYTGANDSLDTLKLYTSAEAVATTSLNKAGHLDALVAGRPVRVGDLITTTILGKRVTKEVIRLIGRPLAASNTDPAPAESNPVATSTAALTFVGGNVAAANLALGDPFTDLAGGATVGGKVGDRFTVRFLTGGAYSITSASGLYDVSGVIDPTAEELELGGGATVSFENDYSPADGDTFVVNATGVYTAPVTSVTGTYQGDTDTTYSVRIADVNGTDVTVVISDSVGADSGKTVVLDSSGTDSTPLGESGLTFTFTSWGTPFRGAAFQVGVTAAKEDPNDAIGVQLIEPLFSASNNPGNTLVTQIAVTKVGYLKATTASNTAAWETGELAEDGILVNANYTELVDGKATTLLSGILFPVARGLIKPEPAEGALQVLSGNYLSSLVGQENPDNLLGAAARAAIAGGNGRPIYILRTAGRTAEDYRVALEKISHSDIFYNLVLVDDVTVVGETIKNHLAVTAASRRMQWRRAWLGVNVPADGWSALPEKDGNWLATVTENSGKNRRLTFPEDANNGASPRLTDYIRKGDTVRFNFAGAAYDSFKVAQVVSDRSLILETGLPSQVSIPSKVEIWKNNDAAGNVAYLQRIGYGFSDYRVSLVWSDNATAFGGRTVNNFELAAERAGDRGAHLPHLPRTNVPSVVAVNAPLMYAKYEEGDLNAIGQAGITIITQDQQGQQPYVRDNISSANYRLGDLYREESCVSNFDDICYGLKTAVRAKAGQANMNPNRILDLRLAFINVLLDKQKSVDDDAGPQVLRFDDGAGNVGNVRVQADPDNPKRTLAFANITIPVPNNGNTIVAMALAWDGISDLSITANSATIEA